MALKRLKTKTSKRIKRKVKYKIDKRVKQHHRKERREAKKSGKGNRKSKLLQIPAVCPFKENILNDIEAAKAKQKEERKKQFEQLCANKIKQKSLADLVEDAGTRNDDFASDQNKTKPEEDDDYKFDGKWDKEQSLKQYFKEFKKVISNADVLLEVVDARDPLGTRCTEVEEAVRAASGNKRLVVVLNKADLVPRDNLNQWLKYFRCLGPVTIFKASTQEQPKHLGRQKYKQSSKSQRAMQSSVCIGADLLMSMLGNYCRNKGIKQSIRVGIVGIPNVGKSSIINSLARRKACAVGCTPGVTKAMQEVELDSKIKLIDCPGIVFPKSSGNEVGAGVLKNTKSVADVKDPISVAEHILKRASKEYFCNLYDIRDYESYEEFFAKKAARMGKFLKKGVPDIDAAAKSVLNDWNTGKIKYYTQPPAVARNDDFHLSAAIVHEEAKEFNVDNFETIANELLNQFNDKNVETMELAEPQSEELKLVVKDVEPKKQIIVESSEMQNKVRKRKLPKSEETSKPDLTMTLEGNQSLNKKAKKQLQEKRKRNLRNVKKVSAIADVLDSFTLNTRSDDSGDDHDMNEAN